MISFPARCVAFLAWMFFVSCVSFGFIDRSAFLPGFPFFFCVRLCMRVVLLIPATPGKLGTVRVSRRGPHVLLAKFVGKRWLKWSNGWFNGQKEWARMSTAVAAMRSLYLVHGLADLRDSQRCARCISCIDLRICETRIFPSR